MKSLLIIAAVSALATARPELYKENEDFQYSRSSTDEGSKAGFYGAQRGNMGGNYEKSHNMDGLAQHQMSSAVRQVEGELGEGSNTRTGSVYTAANSRGIYGSGRYDLSNLEGRNFQEGASVSDSRVASALSSHNSAYTGSSASHSSGYSSSQAQHSRYQATKNAANSLHTSNIQAAENNQGVGAYDYERQAGYNSGYRSASGYQNAYTNQGAANAQTRLIAAAPARVIIRPGATVIVPVAAQTYDDSHIASAYDQNAINSEAEVLSNTNQQTHYRPTNSAKHYESAYSYRKQWEKHNTVPSAVPLAIPTVNPLPANSELYDDTQALHTSDGHYASGADSRSSHSSNAYSGYNSNVNSASSSQSRYRSGYNTQLSNTAARVNSDAHTHGAYNTGTAADANAIGDTNKPKSYQSSYSYHKSWERQGDPYVIYPSVAPNSGNDGQTSQRLTAASDSQQGYQSHQYGSQARHSHQSYTHGSAVDCDENGHYRVARSYNVAQNSRYEDVGQQEQTSWGNAQQSQNLEDLGQQSQKLEDLGQYNQNLEDLGQQTQKLENFGQYSQNSEDLGQQTQNLNNFGQQSQNLEDFGQRTQNLESFGQRTQKLDDFRQNSQNSEDFGQQTQDLNSFNQHSQHFEDQGQETQQLHNLGHPTRTDLGRQTQEKLNGQENGGKTEKVDFDQQFQSQWDGLEDLGQQLQDPWHTMQVNKQNHSQNEQGQETGNSSYQKIQTGSNDLQNSNRYLQTSQKENSDQFGTHSSVWNKTDSLTQNTDQKQQGTTQHEQETQSETGFGNSFEQQNNWHHISEDQNKDLGQQTQDSWYRLDTLHQNKRVDNSDQVKPVWERSEDNSQQTMQNTGSGFGSAVNNNEQGSRWNYRNKEIEQNRDSFYQQTQSAYGDVHSSNSNRQNRSHELFNSYNSHTNTRSGSSLQSLWDKINNFDQVTSLSTNNNHNDKDVNRNYFSSNHSNSQSAYQNNWRQYNSESTSVNNQNSYQSNQYGTHYAGNHPWLSLVPNEGTIISSTTVKPKSDLGTHNVETSQNSYQGYQSGSHNEGYPWQPTVLNKGTSTTGKPTDDPAAHNVENLSPDDIGRGDIGPEDSVGPVTTTTEISYAAVENKPSLPISISDASNNRYKTPEEIETLSLTKETNKTTNSDKKNDQRHTQVFKDEQNFQEADHVLNVLSISEQKLLEEQKKQEDSQYSSSNSTPIISNTMPNHTISNHYYANHETNEHREIQQFDGQSEFGGSTFHHKPINQEPDSIYKPSDKIDNIQTNIGIEQGPQEIEQQNTEQQFEELGNFGQHSDNLDQQSQTTWGQDLEDLGQQVQSGWRPNEDLQQQSDTQQLENFGRSYQGQYQTQDFYNQRYQPVVEKEQQSMNVEKEQQSMKVETLQTSPDSTQKEERVQASPQNKDVELISPREPTTITEKPGFWKSVGNKFSNAKDKVASWFKS